MNCGPLRPDYLRYKPGESCIARLDDGGAGLIVRAVTPQRYDIYRQRGYWRRPNSPVRYLDDMCTVVLPGSLDRQIKAAKRLLAPERSARVLSRLLGAGDDDTLTVLRHKPGRRIVARIDRAGRPFALLKAVPPARFAKLLVSAEMAMVHGGVPILATDPGHGIIVPGWIKGAVADAVQTPAAFAAIGTALARVHAQPAPPGQAKAHPCGAALTALAQLLPELAAEARALAEGLDNALALHEGPVGLCHGDFSADQVVLGADGPHFIDWDRAGPGPAQGDLGSFLARLDADGGNPALGRVFLEAYEAAAGPQGAAPLFHAAGLAALVCEPFRQRQPDWPAKARTLLRRAAKLAGRAGALARALDRNRMETAISSAQGGAIRLDPPELLRSRPGRRARIAYRGTTDAGQPFEGYGKLRVKGFDRRTPALHRYLRDAGLCDETAVPRVLGLLPQSGIWLQERVDGQVLSDLLRPGADTAPAAAAGRALARLHTIRPPTDSPCWLLENELGVMRDALARAAKAHPHLRRSLSRLTRDLGAALCALPSAPVTGIHRDYYSDQVIIASGRTWLLDLDLYTVGDPAIDVANFVAHLHEMELRHWHAGAPKVHETAFVHGYAGHAPEIDSGRLNLLTRVSLARHIWIATRLSERSHVIPALMGALLPGTLSF
ncbi:MAG: phosphotransferase [Qingshengfaniella sp.]